MESIVTMFTQHLSGMLSPKAVIFVISMFPILELRGGLLAAALLGVEMKAAILYCLLGNMLPIPFILLLVTKLFDWLKKRPHIRPLVEKLENRALGKKDAVAKYEFLGLMLFVGVPLPGTGAWTGSLLAALLGIRLKKSVPAILCGLVMATVIMCIVSFGIVGNLVH